MWIVRVALDRPYTFVVLALLILILSPLVILATPTDIFPNINIPVIAVVWTYTGLNPEEMEGRITTDYERALTTLVDNIQHIESTSYNGICDRQDLPAAERQSRYRQRAGHRCLAVAARQMPPGTQPPEILNYSASSVPILQLGLSGAGMSEQELNDLGLNFLRTQLVTVPGAVIPYPYGGKQREVMINLNPRLLQAKGLSPADVLNAVSKQYLVLPSGTAKISQFEYDVRVNGTPRTVASLNNLPIKTVGNATIYLRDVATVSDGFRAADQHRAPERPARRAGQHPQGRQRLDDQRRQRHSRACCRASRRRCRRNCRSSRSRPVDLREGRGHRRDPRGGHRRRPDRADDPALPRQLAQHPHHRGLHPAVDPDLGHGAELPRPDDQHHDAGRPGAGGRHPGRRRHRHDREHGALPGGRPRPARRDPERRLADRGAGAGLDAVHLHRLRADVPARRRRALSVRAAGRGGGVRHARLLRAVAHAGADDGDVSAAGEAASTAAQSRNPLVRFQRGFERASNGSATAIAAR